MANPRTRLSRGPVALRVESGDVLSGHDMGARIENFVRTPRDTLRGIVGYCPYVPDASETDTAPDSGSTATLGATIDLTQYGTMFGVFQTVLANGREILLIHTGTQIWEHAGWSPARWICIVGPAALSPLFTLTLDDDPKPRWPTQFVGTPAGVVILPFEGRPLFYDGEVCAPLGYDRAPSAPNGRGPRGETPRTNATEPDVNYIGYAHDANPKYAWYKASAGTPQTQMYPDFGRGRMGTVRSDDVSPPDGHAGSIETSLYEAAVQWVDRWGNLSPPSPRSPSVSWTAQSARYNEPPVTGNAVEHRADQLLKQVLWTGLEPGQHATVGRVLLRTKDVLHAGTNRLYEVPIYASGGGSGAFATLPDNESTLYPDNTPDAWLLREALPVVPMPRARLGCLAFGRMWLTSDPANPGAVQWSLPGRWGTLVAENIDYADGAEETTGIYPTAHGVLLCTRRTTCLFVASEDAQFFKRVVLSTQIGCAAPDSIRTLPDGTTVWLSYDGFVALVAGADKGPPTVAPIGRPVEYELSAMTTTWALGSTAAVDRPSGEYRCWVPLDGLSRNERCFVFDGDGWRRRTDLRDCRAVCVTQDHRGYMIAVGTGRSGASGQPGKNGVWVLDHGTVGFDVSVGMADFPCVIESAWVEAMASEERTSIVRTRWWLCESSSVQASVDSYRDWRMVAPLDTGAALPQVPDDDAYSAFWGTAVYDAAATYWTRRRPFWATADLHIPSVSVGKVSYSATMESRPEFIAVTFEIEGRRDGGSRSTKAANAGGGLGGYR